MLRVFVIRGFGKHTDSSGMEMDFDSVDAALITPALARCDLVGGTTGQIIDSGNIRADMFALIVEADVVICDITIHNANVFYELGIRHAMRKKHTVLIKGDPTQDKTPFDLLTDRYLKYPVADPGAAVGNLVDAIKAGLNSHRETDSPIFQMLPKLPEADPTEIFIVPVDLSDEIACAQAAGDKGWLRLIADELEGERFQMGGLELVARAQWALNDYDGARKSWETLRNARPGDVNPNLALANMYERIYRTTSQPSLLEASNQAIRRVLDNDQTSLQARAEALTLHGRNLKTLWRLGFSKAASLEERRVLALEGKLRESFEAYRRAFFADLNSFYPGISALQMGTILQAFTRDAAWPDLFAGNETAAARYREDLDVQLPDIRTIAQTSTANALERETGDARMWASISVADLLFLSRPDAAAPPDPADIRRLAKAYRDAIPSNKRFAWDAAKGQLTLFAELGVKSGLAVAVIDSLDNYFEIEKTNRPVHLVVFTGPAIDGPVALQAQARALIRAKIQALQHADEEMVLLASAAPGAEILAHEVCQELGVRRVLCLPLPKDVVAREVFRGHEAWLARFFAVVKASGDNMFVLSQEAEAPRWLRHKHVNAWERGNKWLVKLAQSWNPGRLSMVAMWDSKDPDASSATAYMVQLARETGAFVFEFIDTKQM